MKTFKTIIMIFLVGLNLNLYGQSYAFRVLVNKGSNQVKSGSDWVALKTGASLKSTDVLKVSGNAYIGLMHSGGKTIEVRDAGTYNISDLEKKVPKGNSVTGKYADYLASQMASQDQKNRLSATGAVHRALTTAAISVHLPQSAQLYNDRAIISWDPLDNEGVTYVVHLTNMFGDNLLEAETTNAFYEINMSDGKLEENDVVLVSINTVEDEDIKSEVIPLKKLKTSKKAQVKNGLDELSANIEEETAVNKLILAAFYEDNSLLADALTCYEDAIRMEPEVESYKEMRDEFLIRNGLKKAD